MKKRKSRRQVKKIKAKKTRPAKRPKKVMRKKYPTHKKRKTKKPKKRKIMNRKIRHKKTPRQHKYKISGNGHAERIRYVLNLNFEFFDELRSLILKSSPAEKDKMIKKVSDLGRIKLAIISGIFLNNVENIDIYESPADLFIVGDDMNKKKLRNFLNSLEAEVGKEIKFTLMDKDEFEYRYGMFDRFVRVLLEGPHEKIINKMGL